MPPLSSLIQFDSKTGRLSVHLSLCISISQANFEWVPWCVLFFLSISFFGSNLICNVMLNLAARAMRGRCSTSSVFWSFFRDSAGSPLAAVWHEDTDLWVNDDNGDSRVHQNKFCIRFWTDNAHIVHTFVASEAPNFVFAPCCAFLSFFWAISLFHLQQLLLIWLHDAIGFGMGSTFLKAISPGTARNPTRALI